MKEQVTLGPDGGIGDILFAHPARFGPILTFTQGVMRGSGTLNTADRELLAAYVSALNMCSFCNGVHAATAEKLGVEAECLEAILAENSFSVLAPKLRPVFAFAHKLTMEPAKVSDADRMLILQTGFDDCDIGDITAIVALFNFFNRLADGHGVKGSPEVFARDAAMLASFGYVPPAQ